RDPRASRYARTLLNKPCWASLNLLPNLRRFGAFRSKAPIVSLLRMFGACAHETFATASSVLSKNSTRMSWRPAERRTSARYVVAGCKIHESSTLTLSAQTRMPSSVVIVNRYLPEAGKSQYPSHRTENVSGPIEG